MILNSNLFLTFVKTFLIFHFSLAHRLIIPVIAFAIFVGVVFTLFSILSNKSDSDVHHRAAVVTNGVECAKMAGYLFLLRVTLSL